MVDICLEAGVNLFDTADVYSNGASETVLGAAIKGRRDKVLISTKTGLPMGMAHRNGAHRAPGSSAWWKTRCVGSAPITSTCFNSTLSMFPLRQRS